MSGKRFPLLLLLALFALYYALGATGFGTDNDTYGMLRAGRDFLRHGTYAYSRAPGYPLPEMVIAVAGFAGGHLLSNLLSALLGVAAVACFYRLAREAFGERAALLSSAAAALNPWWILACSSSMDYVYALGFTLMSVLALRHGRAFLAAVLLAAAVASRLTYLPLGLLAFACAFWLPPARTTTAAWRKRIAAAVLLYAVLALAPYAAIYLAVGRTMFEVYTSYPVDFFGFEGYAHLSEYAGRFAYKNLYLWGLFAVPAVFAAMVSALWRARRRGGGAEPRRRVPRAVLWGLWAAIAYTEVLFFRLPLEVSYLLPLLFPAVFLMNLAPRAPAFLAVVLAGHLAYGVVSLDLLDIRYRVFGFNGREAESVRFGLSFGPGVVVRDLPLRSEAQDHFIRRFGLEELRRFEARE